jgi:hypothetical protein
VNAPTPPLTALMAGVAMAALASCARQEAPPGGPEDLRPPVVVRTQPEAFATVEEVREVRFEFDERVSERVSGGNLNGAISVSPRGGDVTVRHGRQSLTVRMEGGFQPGLVYRVTLNDVVSDLFGNQLRDPFELVFSTGGEAVPTTVAGEVWDRITGSEVSGAVVYATASDGLIHQASTNREGIFALRYMPAGSFALTAFEDANRDGEIDSTEVQGIGRVELSAGDTVLIDIPILAPDTAAAVLVEAEVLDSVTIALEFDDFLEPTLSADDVDVQIRTEEGAAAAVVARFQEADYATFVEEVADSLARLDSIEAEEAGRAVVVDAEVDTVPTDSAQAPAESVLAPPDTAVIESVDRVGAPPAVIGPPRRVPPTTLTPLQGAAPGPTADGRRVLPGKRIVVVLDGPLPYDVPYEVEVAGVVNINGLTGGGGSVEFVRVPPPPDTTAIDTLSPGDSATTGDSVPGADSVPPPDTGAVRSSPTPSGGRR